MPKRLEKTYDRVFVNGIKKAWLPIGPIEALEEKFEGKVLNSFIGHFQKTYIGKTFGRKKTRKEPRFPLNFWNCYDRLQRLEPRTNNEIEGQ